MLCPLPHLLQGVLGQAVLCIVSLSLTVLCQKSERKPKRPKKSPRGQGVLEQRFYTANSSSLQETVGAEESRKKTLHSEQLQSTRDCGSINISKREESREKTLHSKQLQSARDCWSRSISKRGKCQERRFYKQPKLSLQETAEE